MTSLKSGVRLNALYIILLQNSNYNNKIVLNLWHTGVAIAKLYYISKIMVLQLLNYIVSPRNWGYNITKILYQPLNGDTILRIYCNSI